MVALISVLMKSSMLLVKPLCVENVQSHWESGKLVVTGKGEPSWLLERVEYKTKKKVVLVLPQPKKDGSDRGDKKAEEKPEKKAEEKKREDKMPKEPITGTVALKIKLQCNGCSHKIKWTILKNTDDPHLPLEDKLVKSPHR